jgi:hypothetical protein
MSLSPPPHPSAPSSCSTRSETAILYNDRAVLENLHVSSAFKIILTDDANILANLTKEEYRYDAYLPLLVHLLFALTALIQPK